MNAPDENLVMGLTQTELTTLYDKMTTMEQALADRDATIARLKAGPTVAQVREWAFRMKHNDIPDCADEADAIADRMEAANG